MTEITDEARVALTAAAQELRAAAPWFDPTASADMIRAANHCEQVANRIRTGQLIHAVPSDYLTRAHAQIASGQSKENTELDSALIAQPSGDEVEAVARVAKALEIAAVQFTMHHPVKKFWMQLVPWLFPRMAKAAITALDAHRGKQACLKARENGDV